MDAKLLLNVFHPKTKDLKEQIFEILHNGTIHFYFEVQGDYYENLDECLIDAKAQLEQKYKGFYYLVDDTQKQEAFVAGNY